MRKDFEVRLQPGDRERLEGVVADRKSSQHHVWRARIVLMTADGAGTDASYLRLARQLGAELVTLDSQLAKAEAALLSK